MSAATKRPGAAETRERLLDAAEELFSMHGIDGTSVRSLTKRAGVNLAAVSYHFGSKDGLLDAVLERRVAPINARRLAALDALEAEWGEEPVPLRELLRAFVDAPLRHLGALGPRAPMVTRFLGRAHTEPREQVQEVFRRHFGPIVARFLAAFSRTLPGRAPEELMWRMMAVVGVFSFFLSRPGMPPCGEVALPELGLEAQVERVLDFVEPGFRQQQTGA